MDPFGETQGRRRVQAAAIDGLSTKNDLHVWIADRRRALLPKEKGQKTKLSERAKREEGLPRGETIGTNTMRGLGENKGIRIQGGRERRQEQTRERRKSIP